MRETRHIRLVVFDCDGVLFDSEPIASRVLAEALTAAGYPVTPEACRQRFTGFSTPAIVAMVEADRGRPLPDGFEERLRRQDRAAFSAELEPVSGVAAALGRIPLAKCVASSGSLEKIRHSLALTGLLSHFEPHLFSTHMVATGKPAPDVFLLAAARMGVPPNACAAVEDSVAGVEAARAAGMMVLGFAGASHAGADHAGMLARAGADAVFGDMAELPGLLGV